MPWRGVDPIVVGSQIVLGLQTIVSRRMDITKEPSVVTVGVFHGGVRHNIIPDEVKIEGTIRTFDEEQRNEIHEHVKRITEMIAAAGGAKAQGAHPPRLRRDGERSRAHRVVDADARAHRGRRERGRRRQGLRRRGLLVLPEGSAGLLLLPGLHAAATATPRPRRPTTARASTSTRTCLKLGVKTLCRARARLARRERLTCNQARCVYVAKCSS